MTYRDLIAKLQTLSADQLDCDLTIQIKDEFYPARLDFSEEDGDILDPLSPFFVLKETV